MEQENQLALKSESVVKAGHFNLYLCVQSQGLDYEKVIHNDAVILEAADLPRTLNLVKKIRSHSSPECYLKPIFLYKGSAIHDLLVQRLTDGVLFSLEQANFLIPTIENIQLRKSDLNYSRSTSFETQMIDKCLNYLYTRQRTEFSATHYTGSSIGFSWPELSVNFHKGDEWQVLSILGTMETEGILQGKYADRIYLCHQCHGGYMIYREVCPGCGSTNCSSEDLIHHYPCAFIGPMSDFHSDLDSSMHCPKCDKKLRHIGVDYDKPSVIYTCQDCNGKFQDIHIKAKCLSCLHENEVDKLVRTDIKNYHLTKKGETAATRGYVPSLKETDDYNGTVKIHVFKTLLRYEIERLRQTNYTSNLALIHLQNIGKLYTKLSTEAQHILFKDLVGVISQNLRSSDVICVIHPHALLISMNEIPEKVAGNILNEICDIIKRLIRKNFNSFEAEILLKQAPINTHLSNEIQIQQITQGLDT